MDLIKIVKKFLEGRWEQRRPLLLGYSGGPDSKALLYALIEAGVESLHLAHVDHGWRDESKEEADRLAKEAAELKLPFYCVRLGKRPETNLEDFGRASRLEFFRSLFDKVPFQALLLAHHKDDAAETTLKRIFEGAHLANLGGIAKSVWIDKMLIWRPFLEISKQDICEFLRAKSLESVFDYTNEDDRFLRTRLRKEIFPALEQSFGKSLVSNLNQLSERSFELKEYLDRKTETLWKNRLEGPWGICLDLQGVERLEARHVLQMMTAKEGLILSRELLESWLDGLEKEKVDLCLETKGRTLLADRGRAFLFATNWPQFKEAIYLKEGRFVSGHWTIEIRPYSGAQQALERGWQKIWKGSFETGLPNGVLELAKPDKMLQNVWRQAKVPAFFRKEVPVIINGQKFFELLTPDVRPEVNLRWIARFSLT